MFNYVMSPTGKLFHESDKYVKMLCGPYGSGKSCCCAVDVLSYACAQAPASDGVRYSRVGVIRSTYPELTSMTRKSLMEVLPAECGSITGAVAPLRGIYTIPLTDGTTVNLELNLFALQTADDCAKILSANWSFAWINEATGCAPEVFAAVQTRIGRFPSMDMGGVSWGGIIMDFNQPTPGSWLDIYMKNPEENWGVFVQPPAAFQHEDETGRKYYTVNDDAENLRNLGSREEGDPDTFANEDEYEAYLRDKGKRYYQNQINTLLKNGREDVVQNQYCMMDVPVIEGKPVYSNFSRTKHVAPSEVAPEKFQDIVLGIDTSGVHPAAVVLQNIQGRWTVLDEVYAQGEGLENFIYALLVPLLREKYPTNPVVAACDPANSRDSWTAVTPSQRFEEVGIRTVTELTNSPKVRIQTVEHMLNIDVGGLVVSPTCELLIRGFLTDYRYRRLRASGSIGAAYTPVPEKNDASHLHDALQYAALYIQQGRALRDDPRYRNVSETLSRQRRVLSTVA